MSIYVKFERPETPEEFIKQLYSSVEDNRAHSIETYSDSECAILQCNARRIRSFDDIYELITTYYPELTIKDVIKLLVNTNIKSTTNEQLYIFLTNCSIIYRINFFFYNDIKSCSQGYDLSKMGSKHTWKELLAMIDINSKAEFEEYLKTYIK